MNSKCLSNLSRNCSGKIECEMNYPVHKSCCKNSELGCYELTDPSDGEKVCRVKIQMCNNCALELEKKLTAQNKESLIIRNI
jgi:hypothetical protein